MSASTPASSRPTTSAASIRTQIDEDVAYRVGRAFARVLADLRGGARREGGLRLASATTCASTPPRWPRRSGAGSPTRAAACSTSAWSGPRWSTTRSAPASSTAASSVTASHNPKAWAGFKLLREGALALSGDTGIRDVQRAGRGRGLVDAAGRGHDRVGGHLRRVPALRARLHRSRGDPADGGRARRRQRHGGADDRARSSTASRSRGHASTSSRTASSPATGPTPCSRRTAS